MNLLIVDLAIIATVIGLALTAYLYDRAMDRAYAAHRRKVKKIYEDHYAEMDQMKRRRGT